mmetsp:Transcript_83274/g.114960  ORF Transcript_83274/g.114960 Transcript_83274/m.114960 type:complete len:82 (+) Transcript_83274:280-525(+)
MSMVWLYFMTNAIVDLLELYGILTGIQPSVLGLTIIAWGNGTSDTIASASLSKKGSGEMALTFCIAGPIFNMAFGLGLTLT